MQAYCFRSGEIKFGGRTPKAGIMIAKGPCRQVRALIQPTSRLAYDNKTLLVPGIPEADSDDDAALALGRYLDWLRPKADKSVTVNRRKDN